MVKRDVRHTAWTRGATRARRAGLALAVVLVAAPACLRSGYSSWELLDLADSAPTGDAGAADAPARDAGLREASAPDLGAGDGALCVSPFAPDQCLPKAGCLEHTCTDLSLLLHFDNLAAYGEDALHVHDFSGNANDATCSATTCPNWSATAGKFGGAYVFSGGPRLEIQDAPSLDLPDAVTVSAWFLPYSLLSAWRPVVSTVEESTERSNFWIGHNGTAMCITFNDGSWHNRCAGDYATGTWYHLAGVFDDLGDRITLYVNGVAIIDEADSSELPVESGSTWIGGAPLDDPVTGVIDEVIIFKRALGPAEILELYQ